MFWRAMRRGRPLVAVSATVGLALVGLGVVLGALLIPDGPYVGEEDTAESTRSTSIPVTTETFTDPVSATLTPTWAPEQTLSIPTAGVITSLSCRPGEKVESGTVAVTVGASPVGVLSTKVPLWRDITVGDKGSDVRSLTGELARLGAPLVRTSHLDVATARVARDFLQKRGFAVPSGGLWSGRVLLPRSNYIWLPRSGARIASCDTVLGAQVNAGASLATLVRPVVALETALASSPSVAGGRRLLVDAEQVALPKDRVITDPHDIALIMGTPSGQAAAADPEKGTIDATYALRRPVDVMALPPAAVIDPTGDRACVIDEEGRAHPVTILATDLGQVLASLAEDDQSPPARAQLDTAGSLTCP